MERGGIWEKEQIYSSRSTTQRLHRGEVELTQVKVRYTLHGISLQGLSLRIASNQNYYTNETPDPKQLIPTTIKRNKSNTNYDLRYKSLLCEL